jgi:hypothetical protein
MGALPGHLDDLGARREPGSPRRMGQRRADGIRDSLADGAAALANQEHQDTAITVLMRASDEGVPALDAMGETLVEEEVERAIDGDGRRAMAFAVLELLDELIGADGGMGCGQGLQDLSPHEGQARAALGADTLRPRERRLGARCMVVPRRSKEIVVVVAHAVNLAWPVPTRQGQRAAGPPQSTTAVPFPVHGRDS